MHRTDVACYSAQAPGQSKVDVLMHIKPNRMVDAFVLGEILQILLIAPLFRSVLAQLGGRGRVVTAFIDGIARVLFGIVHIVTKLAPIGASFVTMCTMPNRTRAMPSMKAVTTRPRPPSCASTERNSGAISRICRISPSTNASTILFGLMCINTSTLDCPGACAE
ncbi:hypothetical protein CF641_37495 [Burkholderia pseudomallei]|nr:hypothetical protein CF641_37495 [Burkholderia pseudomallei]